MREEALKDLLALRGQSLDPVLLQNTVNKNPIYLFFSFRRHTKSQRIWYFVRVHVVQKQETDGMASAKWCGICAHYPLLSRWLHLLGADTVNRSRIILREAHVIFVAVVIAFEHPLQPTATCYKMSDCM